MVKLTSRPSIQQNSLIQNDINAEKNCTVVSKNLSTMSQASSDDIIEQVVCKVDDLENNQMKEYAIGEHGKVLLIKENGEYSAIGTKCTHYGAPLVNGVLCNGKVRCQWHGACFNTKTGDIEDFPGLDSLPKYEVKIVDDDVVVKASKNALKTDKRIKNMCKRDESNKNSVVIIGGGVAAQVCAETLRQEGFTGNLKMVTNEEHYPYDRPMLSKALGTEASKIVLRDSEFYCKNGIEVMTRNKVIGLNVSDKCIEICGGIRLKYGTLVIAAGCRPNLPRFEGLPLENVFLLRTPNDSDKINKASENKDVVIIGTSFIGMEVASFLSDKAASVTVIGRSTIPFLNVFGEKIGSRLKTLFEENSVKFKTDVTVSKFIGVNGKLSEILLTDGCKLKADVCVFGLGVVPNTEFLKGSPIRLDKGYIVVDKFMRTSHSGIYAAGDIVQFPLAMANCASVSIGHWQMAQEHGRIAALNILKKCGEIKSTPYFWSLLLKNYVRFAGFNNGFDDVIIDGSLEDLKFAAYFCKGDKVVGVAAFNRDPLVTQYVTLLSMGKILKKRDVKENPMEWIECL